MFQCSVTARGVLCFAAILLAVGPAKAELLVEISSRHSKGLAQGFPEMQFGFLAGGTLNLIATAAQVGQTFSAPGSEIPLFDEYLTRPEQIFVSDSIDGTSYGFISPPGLDQSGMPIDFKITRHVASFGPNLFGYSIHDVTHTIDEITITQTVGSNYTRTGAHTIRIYGDVIPEPSSWLILLWGILSACGQIRPGSLPLHSVKDPVA
jgi:hypothetical protein